MSHSPLPPHRRGPYQGAGFRRPATNSMGVAGLLISIFALIFTCGLLSPVGLLFSMLGLRKQPRGEAIAGTVIGGFGTLAVASVVGFVVLATVSAANAGRQAHQQQVTQAAIQAAEQQIEAFRMTHGELPGGIEGNKLVLGYTDAWGTSLRYDGDPATYRIRSAGRDQEFDTGDDILAGRALAASEEFDDDDDDDDDD